MKSFFVVVIIFVGLVMISFTEKHQVSSLAPTEKKELYTEHWMLPAKQLFLDGLVPVVLTNKYPIVDASGVPRTFFEKGTQFFQRSLPPP